MLQALASKTAQCPENAIDAILLPPSPDEISSTEFAVPWGAAWDNKPAVGMPRKFSMAVMMMMVTLFAVMFSILRWLDASPIYYGIFGVLVFGVTMGQMVLFGGKYPRAASIWSGAVLLPLEIGAFNLFSNFINVYHNNFARLIITFFIIFFTVPVSAVRYLAGGLTAGVVLLLERKKDQIRSRPTRRMCKSVHDFNRKMPYLRALILSTSIGAFWIYFGKISIRVLVKATKNDRFRLLILWESCLFIR